MEKILEVLSLQWSDLMLGCAQNQTRVANNRAHGSAQFMVDVGEKLRLELARFPKFRIGNR